MKIDFKGSHFPKEVIMFSIYCYARFALSFRDIEELLQMRGANVDHATIQRWVVRYGSKFAENAKKRRSQIHLKWHIDETYVTVKGDHCYLYRAIDNEGQTIDFMLSEHRDETAATAFFMKTIDSANLIPDIVFMDKSGANETALVNINLLLFMAGWCHFNLIRMCQIKRNNNRIEQDHRFIKRITKPMMGFKAFHSACAIIDTIETVHMIRKGQIKGDLLPLQKFMLLAE
jgi:putative transposase